ncbi:cyclophilin-like domain-containing protein [Diplogelasinospora grovesii]|uniref:Peptidyl-prolyl cis-trans isomerase n=1 Tax=Diplogelasinospora grovesii TaxID=303347 RepID=A0AAN6S5B6_9PEZI|nr:cyclophilin-like domain-containing protein [Diplogelasinospora grovesii]
MAITASEVAIETNMGSFTVELYYNHAPKACKNFSTLAKRGYYNGTLFHRVVDKFCIQGGDPTGTGKGGQSIYGAGFEDEFHPDLKYTGAGILGMANSGPNTNGSQFFITLDPAPWLDGGYPIFGRVKTGMATVKRIGRIPTDSEERPLVDVKIISTTVEDKHILPSRRT